MSSDRDLKKPLPYRQGGMTTMHFCRGNIRITLMGSMEAVLAELHTGCPDGYLVELFTCVKSEA